LRKIIQLFLFDLGIEESPVEHVGAEGAEKRKQRFHWVESKEKD